MRRRFQLAAALGSFLPSIAVISSNAGHDGYQRWYHAVGGVSATTDNGRILNLLTVIISRATTHRLFAGNTAPPTSPDVAPVDVMANLKAIAAPVFAPVHTHTDQAAPCRLRNTGNSRPLVPRTLR